MAIRAYIEEISSKDTFNMMNRDPATIIQSVGGVAGVNSSQHIGPYHQAHCRKCCMRGP